MVSVCVANEGVRIGRILVPYAIQIKRALSANAVAAMVATDPRASQFADELFKQRPPTGKWRYYDGMLYTMALLHLSGKFRIFAPPDAQQAAASAR